MAQIRRKKRASASSESRRYRRTVVVEPEALEIVRGHDGLLRGQPEPALILGLYRVGSETALLGRAVVRVRPRGRFPLVVPVTTPVLRCDARLAPGEHVCVLALAVEEDGGCAVEALCSALEETSGVLLYHRQDPVPEPRAIAQLALRTFAAPTALPVEVLFGTQHASALAAGDEFVGASAAITSAKTLKEAWRFRFADTGARNDWVLNVRLRVR